MNDSLADADQLEPDPSSPYYSVTTREGARPWLASVRESLQLAWIIGYLVGVPALVFGISQSWHVMYMVLCLVLAVAAVICVPGVPLGYLFQRGHVKSAFPRVVDFSADAGQVVVTTPVDHLSIDLGDCDWAEGTTLQGEHGALFPVRDAILLHVGYTVEDDADVPYVVWIEAGDVCDRWRTLLSDSNIPRFEPARHRQTALRPPAEVVGAGIGVCIGMAFAVTVAAFWRQWGDDVPQWSLHFYGYATGAAIGYVNSLPTSLFRTGPVEFGLRIFVPGAMLAWYSKYGDRLDYLEVALLVFMYAVSGTLVGIIHAHRQAREAIEHA